MKKIFTKFSLLFIGLMLCIGNVWAEEGYNDPVGDGDDGYYQETCGPVTYRIDYTVTNNGSMKIRNAKLHNGTQTAYIHSHNGQALLTLISEISLINIENNGVAIQENSFPVAIEPGTFTNYTGFIFLPEWNSADETKNIYYKGTDNGMPVWGDVFGPNAKVYVSNNTNFVLYSQQHGEHTLNNTTYYYWEGHIASADIINSHNILHEGDFGTNNALHWTLYDDGSLSITGSGAMPDFVSASAAPWNEYRNDILFVIIGKDIMKIGANSFGSTETSVNYPKLYSVSFEDGSVLTEIGANAFYYAAGLFSIELPNTLTTIGNSAFSQCDKLQSITLPASVTTLGQSIFALCDNFEILTSLNTTPPTIDKDGNSFFGSTQLHTIIIPEGSMCDYHSVWGTDLRGGDSYDYKYTIDGEALECLTGTCGENLNWSIEGGVLTISGTGTTMTNYTGYDQPWYANRNDITSIHFNTPNLENIGNYAFYQFQNAEFTEVTIPNSVISIGSNAFRDCSKLTAIHLGSAVRTIGSSAFRNCSALTEPICNGYMFVQMPTSYSGAYTIQEGTVKIEGSAFSGCKNLTSVTIPSSVTTMGTWVFNGCTSLTSASFASSMTTIEAQTYYGCTSLTSVTIPDNVTTIGASAFSGCTALSSVTLGASINSVGAEAFANCPLTSPLKTDTKFFVLPTNYSGAYEIPEGIVEISDAAFKNCRNLTAISIPNSVTTIRSSAFEGCNNTSFTEVTIPNSVTTIGASAFSSCNKLVSVTMPTGITSIPSNMFRSCTSLSALHMRGLPPKSVGATVFPSTLQSLTFYVPKGTSHPYEDFLSIQGWSYSIVEENVYGDVTAINDEYEYWANWYDEDPTVTTYKDAAYNALVESASTHESVENFTIVRPIQANGYLNTICLPFDLSEAQIANSDLAGAEIFAFDAQNSGAEIEMVLNEVTEMEAGMPYFFRYPNGTAETPNLGELNFHDVTISTATTTPKTVDAGTFRLKGTLQNTLLNSATNYLFLGANDALFYPDFGGAGVTNDDLTLRPFRAYFEATNGSNNAPARITFGRNTATDVEKVQEDNVQTTKLLENGQLFILKNGVKYNAQGRVVK